MQKKISCFFKRPPAPESPNFDLVSDDRLDETWLQKQHQISIKYARKPCQATQSAVDAGLGENGSWKLGLKGEDSKAVKKTGMVLNKKRKYVQYHLELGQSDFLLHTCKICGIKYAKGDEDDEKVHSTFHKNYTHGIPFKGWRHERLIHSSCADEGRILLVLNNDPPAQRNKGQEVVKMMEIELGDGWIFHSDCKVYLFIASQRVVGCLVAEPIKVAHRLLSVSMEQKSDNVSSKVAIPNVTKLQFGNVTFYREVAKRNHSDRNSDSLGRELVGVTFCEKEVIPASCGVRAVWVTPSNRRKQIATQLLDALRQSFCTGSVLERNQLAFSQPTSAGKALASKFTGTGSFLVYQAS